MLVLPDGVIACDHRSPMEEKDEAKGIGTVAGRSEDRPGHGLDGERRPSGDAVLIYGAIRERHGHEPRGAGRRRPRRVFHHGAVGGAGKANLAPTLLRTSCVVTLDQVDGAWSVTESHLDVTAKVPVPRRRPSARPLKPRRPAARSRSSSRRRSRWTRGSSPSRPNGDQDCGTDAASRTQRKPRWLLAGAHFALAARADHVARAVVLDAQERAPRCTRFGSPGSAGSNESSGPRGFRATPGCAASVA